MWNFSNLARRHSYGGYNRAEGESPKKHSPMMNAGIYKGAAVLTAGLTGGVSAYKGIPEISGFAGFDVLGGLVLSAVEFGMMWKGHYGKLTATVGGVSTGLLCHWAAVQGTIWGAGKAKSDAAGGTATKGFDYSDDNQLGTGSVPYETQTGKAESPGFQPFTGHM